MQFQGKAIEKGLFGKKHLGNVTVDVEPGAISIYGDLGTLQLKKIPRQRVWQKTGNILRILFHSPVLVAEGQIFLQKREETQFLCIDPGWPFEEPLLLDFGEQVLSILETWKQKPGIAEQV